MKRMTAVLALAAIASLTLETTLEAGPRGGRGGGSRGGHTTRSTPSFSGTNAPTRNQTRTPSINTPSLSGKSLDLNKLNRTGFDSNQLGNLLDGKTDTLQNRVSRDQLNSFLELPTESAANRDWKQGERSGEIYNDINNHLAGQPEPFSAAWYAQHPQAWQYTHPHADAWAAATWGAVTGWVAGVAATPAGYSYGDTVVYVESAPTDESTTEAIQTSEANELAATPAPADSNEEWLPLGVFALVEGNSTSAQMMFQLSVSKSGHIGGSYFNVISGTSQPISGAINKETQQAAWSVAGNDAVVFHSDLASLTTDEANVLIHHADGETQKWTLVRLENDND